MDYQNGRKKHYEYIRFNVISVTREWVGVKFPEKSLTKMYGSTLGGGKC